MPKKISNIKKNKNNNFFKLNYLKLINTYKPTINGKNLTK